MRFVNHRRWLFVIVAPYRVMLLKKRVPPKDRSFCAHASTPQTFRLLQPGDLICGPLNFEFHIGRDGLAYLANVEWCCEARLCSRRRRRVCDRLRRNQARVRSRDMRRITGRLRGSNHSLRNRDDAPRSPAAFSTNSARHFRTACGYFSLVAYEPCVGKGGTGGEVSHATRKRQKLIAVILLVAVYVLMFGMEQAQLASPVPSGFTFRT